MAQSIPLNSNQTAVIANAQNLLSNVLNQAIVRPTGGNPTSGINGFVFDIFSEEEISIESDITDHYVEDNYAIQDHIAQKPIRYICKGFIGELANLFPNSLLSILTPFPALNSVVGFLPTFSAQASQFYAQLSATGNQIQNIITQAKSVYSLLTSSSTTANKQQNAYTALYNFWINRQLCTVETPYGVLYNMAIERLTPMQPENTLIQSEFTLSFKQIRLATTQTTPLTINNPAGSGTNIAPASASISGNYGLPTGSSTSPATGLLDTSIDNLQSNSAGRVSQMLTPLNINGQTSGATVTGNPVLSSFGL